MEVVVLTKDWFFYNNRDFSALTKVVNKAYDKVHKRFGHIQNPRIKTPEKFLQELGVSKNDEFIFFVLIAPSRAVAELPRRSFNPLNNYDELLDCQIPIEVAEQLKVSPRMRFIPVTEEFEFTDDILHRVLMTVGLKSNSGASGQCPVDHKAMTGSKCPVAHTSQANGNGKCPVAHTSQANGGGKCPVAHSAGANGDATAPVNGNGTHSIDHASAASLAAPNGVCPVSHATAATNGGCPVSSKTSAPAATGTCPVTGQLVAAPALGAVCPVTGQSAPSFDPHAHGGDDPNAVCPVTGLLAKDKQPARSIVEAHDVPNGMKEATVTAFTLFLPKQASVFLDVVLDKLLNSHALWSYFSPTINLSSVQTLKLLADTVKEHRLVEFYCNYCDFTVSQKEPVLVKASSECPFPDEVVVAKPFHVVYTERLVTRKRLDERLGL